METISVNSVSSVAQNAGRSLWSDALRRLRRRKTAMFCFAVIIVYFSIAAFLYAVDIFHIPLAVADWSRQIGPEYQPPGAKYIFGTDFLGRSVFRKALYGAKTSITVALWASLISISIGVPLGAMAGYFRGIIDQLIVWLYTTLSCVPYILLILAFALVLADKTLDVFGWKIPLSGTATVYLAIGLTSWVGICRLIRGEVIKHKNRDYVLAARSYGAGSGRIIFRHLLPNVFHIVIINFSLRFVGFIQAEVILSFLGLGEKNSPSWGAMIDSARLDLPKGYWWEMTAATAAIFVISLALNVFGDALRDCLDPKLRTE